MIASHPARWNFPPAELLTPVEGLMRTLGLAAPAARILARRGYHDPAAARRFLEPSIADLHDPFLLAGMETAVERLLKAIRDQELVLLYGDYDVDGTTSVVLLSAAIRAAGGRVEFYIPDRLAEGYGMRPYVMEDAAKLGVRLIISVDTGIREVEAVRRAVELGLDVIITDHHLPDAVLPPAYAVINPNQECCQYPDKSLCAVAVTLKLAQALLVRLGWEQDRQHRFLDSFLKLVAIGTVADLVPLTGENRILVKFGLAGLRQVRNPGLRALLNCSGYPPGTIPTAGGVAFRVAPRINAAGRMATAHEVIELFTTSNPTRAGELAERLSALNAERQAAEAATVDRIKEQCEERPVEDRDAGLVFVGENWHKGVVGIAASRVVDLFHRPTFVLSYDPETGEAVGSGRSIAGFHLLEALESISDVFRRFGGHRQAAGVTLEGRRVDEFRERFRQACAQKLRPEDFCRRIRIDAVVDLAELNERSVAEIWSLEPFGMGNPEPVLALRNVELATAPSVFKEKHVRLAFRSGRLLLTGKAWNFAERAKELELGVAYDVAFSVEEDSYAIAQGSASWSATVKDIRPSSTSAQYNDG